mmetsp:Transcript_31613/g.46652  ORF Transcript_31613/g.46652 Transcript_31613/m.46652 type:complete len:204 (+) Transcript_31613:1840-2451(+)
MEGPTTENGVMGVGTALVRLFFLMVTLMRANTNLISDTGVASIVGKMAVFTMENLKKTVVKVRDTLSGRMELPMTGTLFKVNERDMDNIILWMEAITREAGWMGATKDLENVFGTTVVLTKANGVQEWRTEEELKPTRTVAYDTMENGLKILPLHTRTVAYDTMDNGLKILPLNRTKHGPHLFSLARDWLQRISFMGTWFGFR